MLKNLIQDKKAKTPSFFFKKEAIKFDLRYVKFLENYYRKNSKDVRICLHTKKKRKTSRYDYITTKIKILYTS